MNLWVIVYQVTILKLYVVLDYGVEITMASCMQTQALIQVQMRIQ